jgi:hypothetical protein
MRISPPLLSSLFILLTGPSSASAADLYVSPMGAAVTPFSSWDTVATNIQDAIDAASIGDTVWVTNGIYSNGGKLMGGEVTNRVVLDKALTVQSVNGPLFTIIEGAWDPVTTNGPMAVRCAWLTNGALLSGFTLQGGATGGSLALNDIAGGGALGGSNALVANCVIRGNCALGSGGGASRVGLLDCTLMANCVPDTGAGGLWGGGSDLCNLTNCVIVGNSCGYAGGGVSGGILRNCFLAGNTAHFGGGVESSTLYNCTVVSNGVTMSTHFTAPTGGGADYCHLTNCIVYDNQAAGNFQNSFNYSYCTMEWCCTQPPQAGPGNIFVDPQLLSDGLHLASSSPCRGAGTTAGALGTDIDGQDWGAPPSIGCDEWSAAPACPLPLQQSVAGFPTDTTGQGDIVNRRNALIVNTDGSRTILDGGAEVAIWPEPDLDDLIDKLEWAYQNRDHLGDLGECAAAGLRQRTWDASANTFLETLGKESDG